MNISVKIGNVTYKNPVTVASGTFGHAEKYYNLEEVKKLGAIVPKTVTLKAQEGNPPVRIVETPSGMLNAIETTATVQGMSSLIKRRGLTSIASPFVGGSEFSAPESYSSGR